MLAPSDDIKSMLESDDSLDLSSDNLFVGKEPPEPDKCVTVFDTPGSPPQLTLAQGENYYYPTVQIRVRSGDYRDGWGLINDIKNFLHGKNHETWNGTDYNLIRCSIEPAMLDWDAHSRVWFVSTFSIQRS